MLGTLQLERDDKGIDGREAIRASPRPRASWVNVGESHPWPPGAPASSKGRAGGGPATGAGRPTRRVPTPVRHAISGEWALKECEEHTTWVNEILQRNKYPLIGDLRKGLADGVTLVTLVEFITAVPVAKSDRHPTSAVQTEENLKKCLVHLEQRGVDITGITAKDIADGNLKSTLTLLGNIRQKYDAYGERSDGDGGVAPPQGEIARHGMPGRLYTEGGAHTPRDPPSPVRRERPSSVQRESNPGYYSPSVAQRMIPGMMGGDEKPPRSSSALPFTTTSEQNNSGSPQYGADERRQYIGQWQTSKVNVRPQSAREALGVGSEKPPFHVTNAWSSSQRVRDTSGHTADKPPVAPRPNTQRPRQPSQPTERKEGPRGENLFSRERQPPPPYCHEHRNEQYHNPAFIADNSDDTGASRRADGAVHNDLRSACTKLYGSRSQTPDRQMHGSPVTQIQHVPDINKIAFSPHPQHSHEFRKSSFDQIQHTPRASPMGQSSNSYTLTTDSNARSYTGTNATFSTFKPESDDEEDEKETSVEPTKNTLMPSSKYPNSSGSRPNSARETAVNANNYHLQGFPSGKQNDYYDPRDPNRTRLKLEDHLPSSHVPYLREPETKPQTSKVATMMNSTHINAAYVEDSDDDSDEFRGTANRNKLDYAVESSASITPPLPPLSPGSSRPTTPPPFNPKFGRSYSTSNVSPPKTPDLLSSMSKQRTTPTIRAPEHMHASNPYIDSVGTNRELHQKHSPQQKSAETNPERTYSGVRKVPRGNGLSHSLDDLRESGNESNISFDIENTFLTVEESEQDPADTFPPHKHAHASRKHMDQFEAMYQNMLQSVGVVKETPRHKAHGHVKRRWSLASSDTSSLPKGRRFRGDRASYEKGSAKDIKSIQRRFQRLESHVITLARSVAHLSSELRHNNTLVHELDWIKRELRELRLENHHHKKNPFGGEADKATEFERFRGWIPSLTNPKRVNKLTKFFGQEPPLLQLYLKKLGYERYAKNFENEHIGMIELPYMTEERLESIGIPMGPRLRILQEAQLCFRQDNFNIYIV
ncbi:uncharacterized protein LOC121370508 isoform X2 [Gigantopelta aegis]|uniref:uncharacterized protein LOC121370508 isoform X2 n=1 Tax=Gigantopelta aegis TaxID=1735272 RepID=UPI001B88E2E1|nr:uncharacterized protein LOC121370508 isoform X2 [Gigantopelta aegis]